MFGSLIEKVITFDSDVYRNIKTIVVSENLLDDLTDDPGDYRYGEKIASKADTVEYDSPIITRPFEYGCFSDNTIRFPTRFSDGTMFGVWYGSLELITTVYETVYHWKRMLADMQTGIGEEFVSERRVFLVHAEGMLVDLRGRDKDHPQLIAPDDYTFTNSLGGYLHRNGQNGLLVRSARYHEGVNLAAFKPDILSNVRHHSYLVYRLSPGLPVEVMDIDGRFMWSV